jgi:hypothetical protein
MVWALFEEIKKTHLFTLIEAHLRLAEQPTLIKVKNVTSNPPWKD